MWRTRQQHGDDHASDHSDDHAHAAMIHSNSTVAPSFSGWKIYHSLVAYLLYYLCISLRYLSYLFVLVCCLSNFPGRGVVLVVESKTVTLLSCFSVLRITSWLYSGDQCFGV
jgi:hypothetical protein